MSKKLNRMQFIFVIASFLIVLANISFFTNDFIENTAIKAVVGILIPSVLLILSYEVLNILKLEKLSKIITFLSMFSFFISLTGIYSELLSNVSNVDGYIKVGGLLLNPSTMVAFFGMVIPLIGYFLDKNPIYKKIIVISSLYFFLFGFNSIIHSLTFSFLGMTNNNEILEFVILSVIVLLYNLFLNKEYSKTLAIVNLVYSFITIYEVLMDSTTLAPAVAITVMSIFAFLIRIRKEESKIYDTFSFIGIIIFLINIIANYGSTILILPLGLVILTDMLIVVCDIVKDRKEGLTYKIILDILTMIMLIGAIDMSYHIIPMVLVVLVSSLVSTYALKSDYAEQYVLPFKTVLCIIGLLVEINNHINLDYILIVLIINIFAALSAYFQKNRTFKRLFTFIALVTFIEAISVTTPFEFIVLLSMIVFDYVLFFEADKKSKSFKNLYVLLSTIIILTKLDLFDNALLYLLVALLFIIAHIVIKEKGLSVICFLAFLSSSIYFITDINISSDVLEVLCPLILCGGAFYLTTIIDELSSNGLKALIIIALTLVLLNNSTLISSLVALIVNLVVLVVYMKNNNIIFKTGVVLTILGLLNVLNELDEVPTFVYMLIVGLSIIFIIFKSIQKYIQEPHNEEEEKPKVIKTGKKYCRECGNELSKNSKFCGKCGAKINK